MNESGQWSAMSANNPPFGFVRARVRGAVGRGGGRGRGEPCAALTGVLRALLRGAGKTVRVAAIGADRFGRVFLLERRRAMMTARREKRPLYGLGNVRGNGRRRAEGESGAWRRPGRRGAGASAPHSARTRRMPTGGLKNAFPAPPCGAGRAAPLPGHSGIRQHRAGGDSTCIAPSYHPRRPPQRRPTADGRAAPSDNPTRRTPAGATPLPANWGRNESYAPPSGWVFFAVGLAAPSPETPP